MFKQGITNPFELNIGKRKDFSTDEQCKKEYKPSLFGPYSNILGKINDAETIINNNKTGTKLDIKFIPLVALCKNKKEMKLLVKHLQSNNLNVDDTKNIKDIKQFRILINSLLNTSSSA